MAPSPSPKPAWPVLPITASFAPAIPVYCCLPRLRGRACTSSNMAGSLHHFQGREQRRANHISTFKNTYIDLGLGVPRHEIG